MWHTTRYSMVLWAYPPHDVAATVTQMIRLLGETSDFPLSWRLENQPLRPLPTSEEGWATLARERHTTRFGALDLSLDSPSGLYNPAQQTLPGRLPIYPLVEAVREPPLQAGGLQQLCRII